MSKLKDQLTRLRTKLKENRETGCIEWTGWRQPSGHGQAFFNGRLMPAHRAVFMAVKGVALDKSQQVCHRCDNPPCCNVDHLFVGSCLDNMRDMVAKGRHVSVTKPETILRGSRCHLSKLTDDQVAEIRSMLSAGMGATAIFKTGKFPVTLSAITKIKNGKSRKESCLN